MLGGACFTGKRELHAGFLGGKPERKRLREGLKRRWGDNINMDLNDIGWQGVN